MTKQYTGKKKFKVHNGTFESIEIYAVFEIDFDYPNVKEKIIEMSTFWGGLPEEDDPLNEHIEYLLPIATNAVYHAEQRDWRLSTIGLLDNHLWNSEEGFAYGEYVGIKLVDFYADDVNSDIFEVEEVQDD